MVHTRTALALSSIALTLSMSVAGMAHASADPYDGDDSSEVASVDPGYSTDYGTPDYEAPEYEAPDYQAPEYEAPDFEAPDVSDPGNWDQGTDDYSSDGGADIDTPDIDLPDTDVPDTDEPMPQTAPLPDTSVVDVPDTDTEPPVSEPDSDTGAEVESPEVDTAQVSEDDLDLALAAAALNADQTTATQSEITDLRQSLESQISANTSTSSSWSSTVTQWNSSWLSYDSYYRPIITNPYRAPMQIIYTYDNATRIIDVAPLQRTVLTAPTPGVYNFTAVTQNSSGKPVTVSTGSFSGGGYVPTTGQQPPQKPAPLTSYQNVLVQLRYTTGSSQPFRVKKLTDLGDDLTTGTHRVLLDDETPAWGTWATTSSGERIFEITKTQQLPGLTAPAEGPLPGYDVQLANNEAAPAKSSSIDPLVLTAIGCGALGLASVGFFVISGRRRGENQHGDNHTDAAR